MQSLPEFRLVEDAVRKIDAEIEIDVKIETELTNMRAESEIAVEAAR
jgi:hypothetical protein